MEFQNGTVAEIFSSLFMTASVHVKTNVDEIIEENSGEDTTYIAGRICDYLGIERRGNRAIIRDVLNKNRKP